MNSSDSSGATQRWRLDLAYDGQAFSGFAYQPQNDTVVGLLRATIAKTLRLDEEPLIVGAGRTDAGVHAFQQVVHVDLPVVAKVRFLESERLMSSLNKQMRGRVQILRAQLVDADFHARSLRDVARVSLPRSRIRRTGTGVDQRVGVVGARST